LHLSLKLSSYIFCLLYFLVTLGRSMREEI